MTKGIKSIGVLLIFGLLVGCGNTASTPDDVPTSPNPTSQANAPTTNQATQQVVSPDDELKVRMIQTPEGNWQVDWSLVDSKVVPIDPSEFEYPFALDSEPVKNYANAYQIDSKQAQHSMVLAMASPEVLSKLLDQLDGYYLDHELTDGGAMSLVVYVKPKVAESEYTYVFADTFAKGLSLPVKIRHKK